MFVVIDSLLSVNKQAANGMVISMQCPMTRVGFGVQNPEYLYDRAIDVNLTVITE